MLSSNSIFKTITSPCFFLSKHSKNISEKINSYKNEIISKNTIKHFKIIDYNNLSEINSKYIILKVDDFLFNENINNNIHLVRSNIIKLLNNGISVGLYLDNPLILEHFYDIITVIFVDLENVNKSYNFISNQDIPYTILGDDNQKIEYFRNLISKKNKTIILDCDSKICYSETKGNNLFIV